MVLAQSQFKRALATCLSCCFAWTFFACLWVCSHHADQEDVTRTNYQAKTFVVPVDNDHCQIEQAKVVMPGKQSTISPAPDGVALAFIIAPQYAGQESSAALIDLPPSTADPPFERLCVYRI
jgi:hypothetical protein